MTPHFFFTPRTMWLRFYGKFRKSGKIFCPVWQIYFPVLVFFQDFSSETKENLGETVFSAARWPVALAWVLEFRRR